MRIASVEGRNGISSLLNSNFDENEVMVTKYDSAEDLIYDDLNVFDLILVDMTYNRCLEVIQYIKQTSKVPVIYLTERYPNNPYELEIDDKEFVTHSYTREEFVEYTLKKVDQINNTKVIDLGFCTVEEDNGIFRVGNDILDLTRSEVNICLVLIENMGQVLSKEEIVEKMEEKGLSTTTRSVREHVRKIRKAFEKKGYSPVETVVGKGYVWNKKPKIIK